MGDEVKEIRNKEFIIIFEIMIENIYVEDICEHQLLYDWFYSYISSVFTIATIEEFILECDGFFSYLAIYEIMEKLKNKAEENSQIKLYIKDDNFIKLENIYKEIIDGFSMNLGITYPLDRPIEEYLKKLPSWAMYMNWNYDGYDSLDAKGANWKELNNKHSIQDLIDQIADDILEFDGCKEMSEDLKELKNSILPENTLKREKIEDASSKPSKKQMRVDLPQALGVLAEARTEELIKLNEMFESAGESIKDIIESGEELNDEEEEIKNNIIRTMNREQALGEILSIYYGEEDVIDKNIRRMPTHIVFSTLEEWIENPPYMEDGEADEEKVREHNIFCERLTMSIKLVLNRIKSTMEREKENTEHANKEINNLDEALNILGAVRSMELNVVNEINERFKAEEDEDAKLELSIMGMSSIAKEKALRKVYVEITGSTELDFDNDGIVEIESAIITLESWLKEPIEYDDEEFERFCHDRNKAIEIVLYEIKKDLVKSKNEIIGREN